MPKSITPALDAHRALHETTLAKFVRATRITSDGAVYAFTSLNRPYTIDGITYLPGFIPTAVATGANLSVDNLDVEGALESAGITDDDIRSGKWDGAEFLFFEANWADRTQGVRKVRRGWLGEVRSGRAQFVAELHGLLRRLQQEIGRLFTPGCPWELGEADTCGVRLIPPVWQASHAYTVRQPRDAKTGSVVRPVTQNQKHFRCVTAGTSGGSEPAWNLSGTTADGSVTWQAINALSHTVTVTSFNDRMTFFDSALSFPDEWWSDGQLNWVTGLNAGTPVQFIKRSLQAGGQIELRKPMYFAIQAGDTALITAGCFKRRTEDCNAKYDNSDNFGGFPDLLGIDQVTNQGIA
jgi:hypothetical protein